MITMTAIVPRSFRLRMELEYAEKGTAVTEGKAENKEAKAARNPHEAWYTTIPSTSYLPISYHMALPSCDVGCRI
jgi:hypothetical protein